MQHLVQINITKSCDSKIALDKHKSMVEDIKDF